MVFIDLHCGLGTSAVPESARRTEDAGAFMLHVDAPEGVIAVHAAIPCTSASCRDVQMGPVLRSCERQGQRSMTADKETEAGWHSVILSFAVRI